MEKYDSVRHLSFFSFYRSCSLLRRGISRISLQVGFHILKILLPLLHLSRFLHKKEWIRQPVNSRHRRPLVAHLFYQEPEVSPIISRACSVILISCHKVRFLGHQHVPYVTLRTVRLTSCHLDTRC